MDSQETQSQETTNKFQKYEGIEDALDVETQIVPAEKKTAEIVPAATTEQVSKDYEYTRGNLYSLIEKGQEAVDGILELAQESDSPRAYEVAGNMIKNIADTTDKLIDLQKKMQELEEGPQGKAAQNVTNNTMFVGSTAELAKFLKQQKQNDK
tara:strand:+ start:2657 stop:3115 length:459 start_codon:yes stop_codon:yes gene_type:complete